MVNEEKTVIKNSYLPKKTNECSVPDEYRFKDLDNDMSWAKKEHVMKENNIEYTKRKYEEMGIQIVGVYNDLFYLVELPKGWKIRETDHSMWKEVVDDHDRKRISFFYKGTFYDRDAFDNFERRYSFEISPFDDFKTDATYQERKFKPWKLYITDGGKRIKKLTEVTVQTQKEYLAITKVLEKIATDYLDEHYPDWEKVNAYWDQT